MEELTLFEKAAAIAIKLQIIDDIDFRPQTIMRRASAEEIEFYYKKMCCEVHHE